MATEIDPIFLTADAAATLGRTVDQVEALRQRAVDGDLSQAQQIPAQVTAYDPTGCAWSRRMFDSDGARADYPLAVGGDAAFNPAFPTNGDAPPSGVVFPVDVWLRKRTVTTEKGVVYEFDWPGVGSSGRWALLTGKTYTPGESIAYSFQWVTASDTPAVITWADADDTDASDGTAYQARNLDLPVAVLEGGSSGGSSGGPGPLIEDLSVVWIRTESGTGAALGPNSPSAAASTAADSGAPWSDPTNVFASDDTYATATSTTHRPTADLDVTGFGFAVPAGARVAGIKVEVERSAGTGVTDRTIQLLSAGAAVGSNKADTGTAWPASDATATYGGSADAWGAGLTAAQVNDSSFGVRLQATLNPLSGPTTARVDHVQVTVTYAVDRYLFDEVPWEDLFRLTGDSDDDGAVGFLRYFDQNDNTWKDGREVRVVLAE